MSRLSLLASFSVYLLCAFVDGATREWVEGGPNDCQYVELDTFFGAPTDFGLGPGICYTFFIAAGGTLVPSAFDATCGEDGESVIIRDYSDADCSPLALIEEYTLTLTSGSALLWSATLGGLPATLKDFNCASENRDCYIISTRQYFDGPCDPFGTIGQAPFAIGTSPQINGYCYANPVAGISQQADCQNREIRFYNNLNCDDSQGTLFINTFEEYAFCQAEGPSAQNGGFNESSLFTCTQINDSSSSSSSSSSDDDSSDDN